jgi:hypothetical protein
MLRITELDIHSSTASEKQKVDPTWLFSTFFNDSLSSDAV